MTKFSARRVVSGRALVLFFHGQGVTQQIVEEKAGARSREMRYSFTDKVQWITTAGISRRREKKDPNV